MLSKSRVSTCGASGFTGTRILKCQEASPSGSASGVPKVAFTSLAITSSHTEVELAVQVTPSGWFKAAVPPCALSRSKS